MWILIKLSVTIGAFLFKLLSKPFNSFDEDDAIKIDGIPCTVDTTTHKGKITSTEFSVRFDSKYIFKFTKENWFDRFMKSIGVADEIQSGEQRFDNHVYIASDSRSFMLQACRNPEIRNLVQKLFDNGCTYIRSNGTEILVSFKNDHQTDQDSLKSFVKLFVEIAKIKIRSPYSIDSYAVKALLLEAAIWSIATYALIGFLEFSFSHEDIYLHYMPIFIQGLWVGAIIAILLTLFVIVLMRGSSRGHRLIIESMIVLGLSLPFGGFNIVSDINVGMDDSIGVTEEALVINKYEKTHRSRRGSWYYTYHIQIDQLTTPDVYHISRDIKIPHADYMLANTGDKVSIDMGKGRLKHPYYRSFQFHRP